MEPYHEKNKKQIFCLCENKGADQLRSNCEADQRLCFRFSDSTIPVLSKSKISSFKAAPVTVQAYLCQTWLETKLLVFLRTGSYVIACYSVCQTNRKNARYISELRHEKTNSIALEQVPHKPSCTRLEILDLESRGIVRCV